MRWLGRPNQAAWIVRSGPESKLIRWNEVESRIPGISRMRVASGGTLERPVGFHAAGIKKTGTCGPGSLGVLKHQGFKGVKPWPRCGRQQGSNANIGAAPDAAGNQEMAADISCALAEPFWNSFNPA